MATRPPTTEEVAAEPSEPLKYKTWVLKVSVHCEGCKRKVKKILHGIEGVYTVDVDTKLHKATVTGNVESEILIRKLEKSGKHAELWPEKTEQKESKKSKKKKDKQNGPENNNNESMPDEKEKPEPTKVEVTGPPSKVVEVASPAKTGGSVRFKEVRTEQKKPENQPPVENVQAPASDGAADQAASSGGNGGGGGGSGSGSKRRKKKGQKGNNNGNGNGTGNEGEPPSNNANGNNNNGPARTQPTPNEQGEAPVHRSPPRSYPVYDRPSSYYGPPPVATPVYAVSYNTAYPSSSYTASYYASPPPYSYAHLHQGSDSVEGGPSPLDWNNVGAPQPSDSFEMFSDENPNACYVM